MKRRMNNFFKKDGKSFVRKLNADRVYTGPKGGSVTLLQVMHRNAFIGEEKKKAKRGAGVKGGRK